MSNKLFWCFIINGYQTFIALRIKWHLLIQIQGYPIIDLELYDRDKKSITVDETLIVSELNKVQGQEAKIGGYYEPTDNLADAIMKPSTTLNAILERI